MDFSLLFFEREVMQREHMETTSLQTTCILSSSNKGISFFGWTSKEYKKANTSQQEIPTSRTRVIIDRTRVRRR